MSLGLYARSTIESPLPGLLAARPPAPLRLLRPLQIGEREFVHLVDDFRVRPRRGFEPGPRHGLGRIAVEVEEEETVGRERDPWQPSVESTEVAGRRSRALLIPHRHAEVAKRTLDDLLQLRPRRTARVPLFGK